MLTINQLVEEFDFRVVAGESGLERVVTDFSLKRPSAELMGYLTYLPPQRIQVYGRTELGLLQQLETEVRYNNLTKVMIPEVPCIIVTRGLAIPPEIRQLAE